MPSAFLMNTAVVVAAVCAMELGAWALHRHVMHGWGWGWHASHHAEREGWFERNDLYAIVFAAVSIVLIWYGTRGAWPLQWVGAGMTAYGMLYFLVHDCMVHRRGPWRWTPRNAYLKRLYQAHRLHHALPDRQGGISFGFLLAPSDAGLQRMREAVRAARQRPG
jgi:beta-carotene 3-hydroxylase